MNRLAIALAVFVIAGCGDSVTPKGKGDGVDINVGTNNGGTDAGNNDGTDAGNNGGTDGGMNVPDGSMSSEDAPEIIEFTSNPTSITETGSATLSLIVTDPQGADDVVAVRLLEQSTGTSLGNFSADGGGAYSSSVSWNDLNGIVDITFDGNQSVILTAEAIDSAGERSTRSLSLQLSCSEAQSACEGTCGQLSCGGACQSEEDFVGNNSDCGSCGNTCGGTEICSGIECVDPQPAGGPCTSDADCGGIQGSCQTEGASGVSGGLCILTCSRDGCGSGQECIGIRDRRGNQVPVCFETCVQSADCRTDFECQEFSGNGMTTMVCVPVL